MGRLDGKVAVITGGAGGMGRSHADFFLQEGAKVVIADLESEEARAFVDTLGENATFIALDVTDENNWKQLVTQTEEVFGPIHVLINNAGINNNVSIEESTVEQYRQTIAVNQDGVFMGMKFVLPSMKKAGSGSIVNISSTSGLRGSANMSAYGASKFALRGLTKGAAAEFAPYNIRVNTVHPGVIETPLIETIKDMLPVLRENIPLERFAQPKEVSNLVLFLASDESTYSTGAEFIADGGLVQMI